MTKENLNKQNSSVRGFRVAYEKVLLSTRVTGKAYFLALKNLRLLGTAESFCARFSEPGTYANLL